MSKITNGATITVVKTGVSYHTLRDWGLAIGNNNPIGDVKQETFFIDVPGADGFLDYSEALTGRPIFKERPIEITLGGKMDRNTWTAFISRLRIMLHGKVVQIVFDDFPGYYWTGRCEITEYDRFREVGTFKLSIPKADPYGYSLNDNSSENWLWNPFDFELGVIDDPVEITLDGSEESCTITHGIVPFIVTVRVTELGDEGITMTAGGDSYLLQVGENRLAELVVDRNDLELTFEGSGTLQVIYRRRTL